MGKEILISVDLQEKQVAVISDGHLDEFYIERPQDKTVVGSIYKGKVERVIRSINAAFVDIGLAKKGFLYLQEGIEAHDLLEQMEPAQLQELKKGQEVTVQVVKEPFGTKGARLSSLIGLPGRFLVLMPNSPTRGISRRIDDDKERSRLRGVLNGLNMPKDMGVIIRTAAGGKSKKELEKDVYYLLKQWHRTKRVSSHKQAPALLFEDYDLILRIIRDSFTEDVERLTIDSKAEFRRIYGFVRAFAPSLRKRIALYQGDAPLFENRGVDKQIKDIFDKKVYLKSGAYLVIEPTEGLVVVDVNSGRFKKHLNPEEMAFRVNCEAAKEAARQLKLRDLAGIIVIDFIDMEQEGHRRAVLDVLKRHLSSDKAKTDVLGISKFGLVEMTRERVHRTLETMTFQDCPYCKGKGKTKSALTVSIEIVRALREHLKGKVRQDLNLVVHPSVASQLLEDSSGIRALQNTFRSRISVNPDPSVHLEEFRVIQV